MELAVLVVLEASDGGGVGGDRPPGTLLVEGELLRAPGVEVGLYVEETRPDPRGGDPISGWRYAGDARLAWVSTGVGALQDAVEPLEVGARVRLGDALGAAPIAPWAPPAAIEPVQAAPLPAVAPEPIHAEPAVARRPLSLDDGLDGVTVERSAPVPHALRTAVDWADDGHGSGVATVTTSWWTRPDHAPRLEIGLVGWRGQRWLATGHGPEGETLEPAVAYGLYGEIEPGTPTVGVTAGLLVGIDADGPALGASGGLRLGPADGSRTVIRGELSPLGARATADARFEVHPALRLGARARVGALPVHDGADLLQRRADGSLLVELRSHAIGVTGGVGLAGYDLAIADAGPVLTLELEVRP